MKNFFSKPKNVIWSVVAVVLLMVVVFAATVLVDVFGVMGSSQEVTFTIEEGDSVSAVADRLAKDGIIDQSFYFKAYAKVFAGNLSVEYGVCTLRSNMSYAEIVEVLREVSTHKQGIRITVPEGYNIFDIADAVGKSGLCTSAEFLDVCKNGDFTSYWFIGEAKKSEYRYSLVEGYLFPDTYEFGEDAKATDIVNAMLKNFDSKYGAQLKEKASAMGMTTDEVVVLASVVQCEVGGITSEETKVSSVFHNRLQSDYTFLESDPTIFYGNELSEKDPSVTMDMRKKYSTYVSAGLPVGAICNPGLSAIEASLNPAKTDYKYFVTDANSVFYYAKTYQEHLDNVAYTKTVKKK